MISDHLLPRKERSVFSKCVAMISPSYSSRLPTHERIFGQLPLVGGGDTISGGKGRRMDLGRVGIRRMTRIKTHCTKCSNNV